MRWPWQHRAAPAHVVVRDPGAEAARQRARDADERADQNLDEMRELTREIRHERMVNHFAPLIFDALKRNR